MQANYIIKVNSLVYGVLSGKHAGWMDGWPPSLIVPQNVAASVPLPLALLAPCPHLITPPLAYNVGISILHRSRNWILLRIYLEKLFCPQKQLSSQQSTYGIMTHKLSCILFVVFFHHTTNYNRSNKSLISRVERYN